MDRIRCAFCRNPIKEHQATSGPPEGGRIFHEDCWTRSRSAGDAGGREEQQVDYERRIAADGLAALLSPYVTRSPWQHEDEPAMAEEQPDADRAPAVI